VTEDRHDVVWPLAPLARLDGNGDGSPRAGGVARPSGLAGRRIGFVWDYVFCGDVMYEEIRRELARRYGDLSFVEHERFGNIHGHDEQAVLDRLPDVLRATEVDSVILGVGA
jgi:hypothetical protein